MFILRIYLHLIIHSSFYLLSSMGETFHGFMQSCKLEGTSRISHPTPRTVQVDQVAEARVQLSLE